MIFIAFLIIGITLNGAMCSVNVNCAMLGNEGYYDFTPLAA